MDNKEIKTEDNVEEIEMDLDLTSKKELKKITSYNIDKEIIKKYCTGQLSNDELSRMSPAARKQCERRLKQIKKISKHLQLVADEAPKENTSKTKTVKYSKESLKHKHDIEIEVDAE